MTPQQHLQIVAPAKPKFVPTPLEDVDTMLALIEPTPNDVLYDLGCGDGRVMIAAIRDYGCQAVGIEKDRDTAKLAARKLRQAGITKRWRIVNGDAKRYKLNKATIVTFYLYRDVIEALTPKITHARAIVSYQHPFPRLGLARVERDDARFYVWRNELDFRLVTR